MTAPQTTQIPTGRGGVVFFAVALFMLWFCIDELTTATPRVFTGKGAFIQGFSPEVRAAYFAVNALMALGGCALLFPWVVLRRPYVVVSAEGVRICVPAWAVKRQRIAWARMASMDLQEHIISIWPTAADSDQRPLRLAAKLINRDRLLEAMHPHRPDVVPIPPSVVARRAREAELAARARPRPPQPPTVVSSRGWTG